jgi:hypothetical protein
MAQDARLDWHGDEITRELLNTLAEGLFEGAEHLLQVCNDNYVPVDEGTLFPSPLTL